MFPTTRRPSSQVLTIDGKRYFLATDQQARALSVKRAWDTQTDSRQQSATVGQPFEIAIPDFKDGYGYSFAPSGSSVYDLANGWDLSSDGKATTWPRLATGGSVTDTNYRGWLHFDYTSGYLYMFRGRYATKYHPDDTVNGTWPILEYHNFGSGMAVAGKPALFAGKVYVPIVKLSDGSLQKFQQLAPSTTITAGVQTVTVSGTPTGGTYTLSYNDGIDTSTTTALAYNAGQAAVQAALQALPGLQQVTVVTTGSTPNFTHTVTMTAVPAVISTAAPAQLGVTDSTTGGTHSIVTAISSAGVGDTWKQGGSTDAASYFCTWNKPTVGVGLVRANGNTVDFCTGDPLTTGDWGGAQSIDDSSYSITALATLGRFLMVGRPDGLRSFDESGQTVNEIAAISSVTDAQNFIGMREHNGWIYCPHKIGLFRWRMGSPWSLVGAEQTERLEGDLTTGGWGRTAGIAPYGRTAFITVNDVYNGESSVASLNPPSQQRPIAVPHMHHRGTAQLEDAAICVNKAQPVSPNNFTTFSDDSAVGTIAWSNPSYAQFDDGLQATATITGTTHYLKALNGGYAIPASATIQGIQLDVKRFVTGTSGATFAYTGAAQTWVVPTGVTSVVLDVAGASDGSHKGKGGRVQTTLTTTPGETLQINVGGAGSGQTGGWNGGANGGSVSFTGAGGGGATDIRQGGTTLSDRVVVAGGGGGANGAGIGSGGGGTTGQAGGNADTLPTGGGGGTPSAGGAGGTAESGASNGTSGSLAVGGAGGDNAAGSGNSAGGGGGGGYYGGGGGGGSAGPSGGDAGGGGGSSYAGAGTSATTHTQGYQSGNGYVSISYSLPITDSTVSLVKAGSVVGSNKATATAWPSVAQYVSYGGATDLWGTTWTPAEVNGTTFGAVLSATGTVGNASVEHMRISVYYTLPGLTDPSSYLAVISLDSTLTTATPVIYKLPRAGLTVANDPNIDKAVSLGCELRTSRYAEPSRAILKQYEAVECYLTLQPEGGAPSGVLTPGVQIQAQVDDNGDWITLIDADGQDTFAVSGDYELFFPTGTTRGHWVQVRAYMAAASATQVGLSVTIRDVRIRGYMLPKVTDNITATLVLRESGQFEDGYVEQRPVERQIADLTNLSTRDPGLGPIPYHDPRSDDDGWLVVGGVAMTEFKFVPGQASQWIATVKARRVPYAP